MVDAAVDRALEKLDASDEQAELVYDHKEQFEQEAKKLHAQRAKAHVALAAELRKDSPDISKVHAQVDARSKAMTALGHKLVDSATEIAATLTPTQRAGIQKKMQEHAARCR